ncbi:MAG: glycosyltransferase family 4 protein [Anaerolineaceae bacterium]|nr:glycosyltransferase family 4 protein [Anaerolineaceae bacterium]
MRVLMLSKACVVGIYQRKLEEIARLGVELLTLVPPSWKDERGETPLERVYTTGYRLETLPIRLNGNFHLHHYPGLGARLREFQPHIVHIDEEPYNLAAWQAFYHARRAGAKTLFFSWQNLSRRYPPPFSWGESWLLRNVDAALMGTESAVAIWREKGYTGPLRVIPQFGTDPELFRPENCLPEKVGRPFTIGFLGRLVEEKGAALLLDAAAQLAGDWRLRVIGSGPQKAALLEQADQLGIAERLDMIEWMPSAEIPKEYARLDVLVLPSLTRPNWKEQFGRVLVEAMATGVPVVGSSSGAIPGVIGDAGLIFPEGDTTAVTDCLRRLQTDTALRRVLAEKGRARVLAHFTHQQVAAATVSLYRELVGV